MTEVNSDVWPSDIFSCTPYNRLPSTLCLNRQKAGELAGHVTLEAPITSAKDKEHIHHGRYT